MQRRIGFHREQVGDLDRADFGDAAEIVAQQVDDHQVFGAVLLVGRQRGTAGCILGQGAAAFQRPLHRPCRELAVPA
ncbi:hypothetical protein D3C87_1864840 [compost metagenome]